MFTDFATLLKAFVGGCIVVAVVGWIGALLYGAYCDAGTRAAQARIDRFVPPPKHKPADPHHEGDDSFMRALGFGGFVTVFLYFVLAVHPLDPNMVEINQHWPWFILGPEAGLVFYLHKKDVKGLAFWIMVVLAIIQIWLVVQTNNPQYHPGDFLEMVRDIGDWLVELIRAPFRLLKKLFSK